MPVKVKNTISKGSIIMHSTDPILFQNSDTKEPPPQPLRNLDKDQVVSMSGSRRSHSARNKIPCVSDCVLKRKDAVDWLSRNPFTRMQAKLYAENHETKLLAQSVLDTENGFVKELDNYLNYRDILELRKKELLHKKWKECVSEPIQKQIKEHINKYCYQEAEQMRNMFLQYLDYCNTKGFVFLKDYDPREYNPFLLHINRPHYFKVSTPILEDPLLIQHQDRMREKGIVLQCQTGNVYSFKQIEELQKPNLPLVPQGRHGVNSIKWVRMPLGDIESDLWQRSRDRKKARRTANKLEDNYKCSYAWYSAP